MSKPSLVIHGGAWDIPDALVAEHRKGLRAALRAGWQVLLQVIDTGPGIAPEERSRIFEEFFRGGAAVDAAPGFGLGLAIVRRAAELLGHRLELASTPGRGTCVQLTLPLAEAPLPAAAVVPAG